MELVHEYHIIVCCKVNIFNLNALNINRRTMPSSVVDPGLELRKSGGEGWGCGLLTLLPFLPSVILLFYPK